MSAVRHILVCHSGRKSVEPGETLLFRHDLAVGSEIIFPHILAYLRELGGSERIDPGRLALVNGHLVPTKEAAAGTLVAAMDRFAREQKVGHYFQAGRSGGCQTLLAAQGLIQPGDLVIGSDLHFTTYGALGAVATAVGGVDLATAWVTGSVWLRVPEAVRVVLTGRLPAYCTVKDLALTILTGIGPDAAQGRAIEFDGDGLDSLDVEDRFVIANLAAETGAFTVWIPPDRQTTAYLSAFGLPSNLPELPPPTEREYAVDYGFDLGSIEPMAALPHFPCHAVRVRSLPEVRVNQVIIGSCTGGRFEDFLPVVRLLESYTIAPSMRLGLYPATHGAIRRIVEEELALFFTRHGASIAPPSCQPCLGSGPSLIGEGEVGVYTTNRNYRGRHGPPDAQIYLAGSLVAAATAIAGVLIDPRDL
ncbi:MAG: 3-isopropylmalate dehydratase large subunit [Calditrichaeota bacterium]|nr:3-isopropylmalate dehydratase large subunit [Calditrichota bacterium]